jgi:hypothetical protein
MTLSFPLRNDTEPVFTFDPAYQAVELSGLDSNTE